MPEPAIPSTFVIERGYDVPVKRLFEAFADVDIKRRWFAEGEGHRIEGYEMHFAVGGTERLTYRLGDHTPFPGLKLESEGTILDLVPEQRIVTSSTMGFGDMIISAALVTIEFMPKGEGSALLCTHQAVFFEGADGPQIREIGWRALFDQLARALA